MDKNIEKSLREITASADKLLFGSKSHDYNSGEVGMEDMFPCGFYSAFTFIYQKLMRLKSLYEAEYPSRPEGHNWPRSYEQYKAQVGSLQEDMDDVLDQLEELDDTLDEIQKLISNLRVQVANKRDK